MPDLKMRPRFAVALHCDAETLVDVLRRHAQEAEPALEGSFDPAHCVLRIPEARRYFWSPELDVILEPREPEPGDPLPGVRARCFFAPRPGVWTGFAFVYAVLAAVTLASGLFGVAQLGLGRPPTALVVAAAAVALIGGIYAATFIGRGLAATQMYELRSAFDSGLERAEARARRNPQTSLDSARL